jgi:cell division transport system ATP-binding protein
MNSHVHDLHALIDAIADSGGRIRCALSIEFDEPAARPPAPPVPDDLDRPSRAKPRLLTNGPADAVVPAPSPGLRQPPPAAPLPPIVVSISARTAYEYPKPGTGKLENPGGTVHIRRGEFVALLGANGSGKSTALKLIAREIVPAKGRVDTSARDCVRLLPGGAMPSFLTVREIISIRPGLKLPGGIPSPGSILRAVTLAGVNPDWFRQYSEKLSSGQQARVALAMACVPMPDLLLADEPDSHLDPRAAADLGKRLRTLADTGMTVVCATHRPAAVLGHVDRAILFRNGTIAEVLRNCRAKDVAALRAHIERGLYEAV